MPVVFRSFLQEPWQTICRRFFPFFLQEDNHTETVENGKKALKPVALTVFKEDAVASQQQFLRSVRTDYNKMTSRETVARIEQLNN